VPSSALCPGRRLFMSVCLPGHLLWSVRHETI
jgi:hypothetical protein